MWQAGVAGDGMDVMPWSCPGGRCGGEEETDPVIKTKTCAMVGKCDPNLPTKGEKQKLEDLEVWEVRE